jgi:hypothetical protein
LGQGPDVLFSIHLDSREEARLVCTLPACQMSCVGLTTRRLEECDIPLQRLVSVTPLRRCPDRYFVTAGRMTSMGVSIGRTNVHRMCGREELMRLTQHRRSVQQIVS